MKPLRGPAFDPHRVPIPEIMRKFNPHAVENEENGAFVFHRQGAELRIIASAGGGWDHVSVSCPDRVPHWEEMEYIKRLFFKDSEVAMQLHVTPDNHINVNPNVLHLWRPHKYKIPLPPKIYV